MNCRTVSAIRVDSGGACIPRMLAGVLLCVGASVAFAHGEWPEIALPKMARPVDIGGQFSLNGLPMRIKGFIASRAPSEMAEVFRRALGQPLMENRIGDKLLLGRMQGDFYLSVQIEPSARGSRGAIAVTNLKLAANKRSEFTAEKERWLNRLPAGSRLLSLMTSEDAGKISTHFVITNGFADSINATRFKSMLAEEGMSLERETTSDGNTTAQRYAVPQGRTLYFRGQNKEAIAVISHANGGTAVVLNIITHLERIQ
jgi:hypothetical protein